MSHNMRENIVPIRGVIYKAHIYIATLLKQYSLLSLVNTHIVSLEYRKKSNGVLLQKLTTGSCSIAGHTLLKSISLHCHASLLL